MTKDESIISNFWQCVDYLESQLKKNINHSSTPNKEIAINLPEFIYLIYEHQIFLESQSINELRMVLPYSQLPRFKYSGPKYSTHEQRSIHCWVFER